MPYQRYQNIKDIQCFTSSQYSNIEKESCSHYTDMYSNTLKFYHDAAKYCQSYYIFHLNEDCDSIQLKKTLPTNNTSHHSYTDLNDVKYSVNASENINSQHSNFLPSSIISLDQAISFYPKPRIVIEAEYPYLIVHTNAGYAHLTGLQTDQIIGHPLFNFLAFSLGNQMSLKHCVSMSEVGKNVDVEVVANDPDKSESLSKNLIKCSLTAYPVMSRSSDAIKAGKGHVGLSHYVLDVIKSQETSIIVDDSSIIKDKVTNKKDLTKKQNKMTLSMSNQPSNSLEKYLEAAVFCQTYYQTHLNEESFDFSATYNKRIKSSKCGGRNIDTMQREDKYDSACINFEPSSTISLCQAIAFYPKPRFIIEATYPFLIVHANAGYSHLTGFESDTTIGQRLMKFMTLTNGNNISLKHCVIMSELGNNVIVEITIDKKKSSSNKKFMKCSLTAYPVMSNSDTCHKTTDGEDGSSKGLLGVSHYVLDMITCQNNLSPVADNDEFIISEETKQEISV